MRNLVFALMTCTALVGCSDKGKDFVGVWKYSDKLSETLTVTKADDGYRALAHIDKDEHGYMDVEVFLYPESDKLLVTKEKQIALQLGDDGKITSHLRNGIETFTKAK